MLDSRPDMPNSEGALQQQAVQFLDSARDHGFQPPFYLVTVGRNGTMVYGRFVISQDGVGLIGNILAEHSEPPGFQAPINLILVDSRGEVMGATIRTRSNGPSLN
jgi:hypothetical protein